MKKIPELMAPAGDFITLSAALRAGADAVYFGLRGSNMRAGARNFKTGELSKIVKECRKFSAKAYLTLNTIYFDGERAKLVRELKAAKKAGVDAVIAWDFCVLELAREIGIEVFLSTQASIANADAMASIYRNYGVKRFVLARECSLDSIKKLRANLAKILGSDAAREISIEVFAHGAMCVSVSGRCFMSQFSCGKSANRGECLQPCRREYKITDTAGNAEFALGTNYVLSPKDLMTLPFIEKLIAAGVNSLKIEGRNRNATYVWATVSAYRRALDFYAQNFGKPDFDRDFAALKGELRASLDGAFNRGFSSGFFMGKPVGDWTSSGNKALAKKRILGHVLNFFPKISVAEISVDDTSLCIGDTVQVEGETTGFAEFTVGEIRRDGICIDSAKKGDIVSLKVPLRVRKNDRLYVLKNA